MTKEQRLYWYRVGREQAKKGLDEPEHGRASKEEEKCWWAGWHSYAAMLPALPTDEPGAVPWFYRYQALVSACMAKGFRPDEENDPNYGGKRTVLVPTTASKSNACPKSDDGLHRPNLFSSPLSCSECNALLRAAR